MQRTTKNERTTNPEQMKGVFGFQKIKEDQKQSKVNEVFDGVANRYDIMNDIMSVGMHRIWKDAMITKINPSKTREWRALDMAGGTADIAVRLVDKAGNPNVRVTVADINKAMLKEAKKRVSEKGVQNIEFVCTDAQKLPFEDNQFDAYSIAFGIRNVPDINKALREAYRVLKPGGQFVCLEFSEIDVPIFEAFYKIWADAIPKIGEVVTGNREAYKYLIESIQTFPNPKRFEKFVGEAGFVSTKCQMMSGGVVALHSGWKI